MGQKKAMFEVNRPGEIDFRHTRPQKKYCIIHFFPLIFNIVFNHVKDVKMKKKKKNKNKNVLYHQNYAPRGAYVDIVLVLV